MTPNIRDMQFITGLYDMRAINFLLFTVTIVFSLGCQTASEHSGVLRTDRLIQARYEFDLRMFPHETDEGMVYVCEIELREILSRRSGYEKLVLFRAEFVGQPGQELELDCHSDRSDQRIEVVLALPGGGSEQNYYLISLDRRSRVEAFIGSFNDIELHAIYGQSDWQLVSVPGWE